MHYTTGVWKGSWSQPPPDLGVTFWHLFVIVHLIPMWLQLSKHASIA